MVSTKYEFQAVPGHAIAWCSVGFLVEDGNPALNAKAVFAGLKIDQERDVRKKFDYWLAEGKHDGWFHGWRTDEDVKYCFTFKWAEKRLNHRFYGYLWNPQPKTNPRFHICVLMFHESKNDESTRHGVKYPFQGTIATTDGKRLWAFRYSTEGKSRSLFFSRDIRTLRELYPERQILHDVSEDARLVLSEPIGDLPGAWLEMPESSYGVAGGGETPSCVRSGRSRPRRPPPFPHRDTLDEHGRRAHRR